MNKKITWLGLLLSVSLILGYVEHLVPIYLGVPGAKLGLPNLAILLTIYFVGSKEGFMLNMTRIILSTFLFSNLYMMMYSLAGGIVSFCIMMLCKRTNHFSIIGVSIAGAVSHNVGQIMIALIVVNTVGVLYYIPMLLVMGMLTGFVIGFLLKQIMPHLEHLMVHSKEGQNDSLHKR